MGTVTENASFAPQPSSSSMQPEYQLVISTPLVSWSVSGSECLGDQCQAVQGSSPSAFAQETRSVADNDTSDEADSSKRCEVLVTGTRVPESSTSTAVPSEAANVRATEILSLAPLPANRLEEWFHGRAMASGLPDTVSTDPRWAVIAPKSALSTPRKQIDPKGLVCSSGDCYQDAEYLSGLLSWEIDDPCDSFQPFVCRRWVSMLKDSPLTQSVSSDDVYVSIVEQRVQAIYHKRPQHFRIPVLLSNLMEKCRNTEHIENDGWGVLLEFMFNTFPRRFSPDASCSEED
ncbi:hypothetical protein HPB51_021323 [Rhipicephalus microplus]|uniref:Uncharacterized protein n=1 Tax=Rhipicephalus microplus TaxID=6941 RepID=A0A9J6F7W8_RHIMP|nr:hypothetical protein HPB51_021323 [Rhipicephalus microplus]